MDLTNRQALVVGMGKSGVAATRFLLDQGVKVTVCDNSPEDKLKKPLQLLAKWPVTVITGYYPRVGKEYDLIVMSPGVPLSIRPVVEARELGLPVIGELDLVQHFCPAPVVAITGTNGKTTTTVLTGEILKDGHREVVVGGNIGVTILEQMNQINSKSVVVAEVSSFQLEITASFKPNVAAILNITPDHLDRHLTFANYVEAKSKIFANQEAGDCLVLNYDQKELRQLAKDARGKVIFFSRQHTLEEGVFVSDDQVVASVGGTFKRICFVNQIRMRGSHNLENCLAATALALAMEVSSDHIRETLATFPGVAHRLEPVAVINGVEYINDSKGTNPDATEKALAAFEQPIILIAGGKDKGGSFDELLSQGKEKIKALVVLGETAPMLLEAAAKFDITNVHLANSFPKAVETAAKLAAPGDVVLLSPACASWDMFNSYEERGDLFKQLVRELRG
ncbi:MAG: UDP-N-acetylmuramoyl-L-alanine--D-glutamate ligase [Clostridia bacterium]|nr:UDP-N-acetylmuramoyl-L-alanine--D-glutamate ligase [Clostridia bacterium]